MTIENLPLTRCRKSEGFTLIEILTVLFVTGIIVSILITGIGKARQSASKAVAASNLRQISTSVITFANDHQGHLPGVYRDDSSLDLLSAQRPYGTGHGRLQDARQLGPYIVSFEVRIEDRDFIYTELLDPPAFRSRHPTGNATNHIRATTVMSRDGEIVYPFGRGNTQGGLPQLSLRLGQISDHFNTSQRWMLIEIDQTSPSEVAPSAGSWPWATPVSPIHRNGWMALMFDGSVDFLQSGDARLNNNRP